MAAAKSPSEIARETLKQLAVRRLPPSPDNYQALYDEIAGAASAAPFPTGPLRHILHVLPGQTPRQKHLLGLLEAAITHKDWSALQNVMVGYANLGLSPVSAAQPDDSPAHIPPALAQSVARLVNNTLPALGDDDARVHEMAAQISNLLREPEPSLSRVEPMLNNFSHRLSFLAEDQAAVRAALLDLLHMVFDNIAALSMDEQWLHGQVEALQAASTPPLTLRRLDDVQRRLKDVIFKQTDAKERSLQAQAQMRELLAAFIERLAMMDESSSTYQTRMEQYAERIGHATRLQDIMPLLEEVMNATRTMALDSRITHGELRDLRARAEATHTEVSRLREELDRASLQARHDPLTGSLNRKGLDEALEREIARARRNGAPLCVALLDIDNFKAINDRLGHAVGDQALVHLTKVTRQSMRSQDQLARYGGEEFVIILPDTALADGVEAMRRLQRELTKHYFLDTQSHERLLITFSAGVAQVEGSHNTADAADAVRRADQAMYLAKRSGKNRVAAA